MRKDASRPPCGDSAPPTMFVFIIFFLFTLLYWCECLLLLLIRLNGRPSRFRPDCGRSPPPAVTPLHCAVERCTRCAPQLRTARERDRDVGKDTACRVHHRCTRLQHTAAGSAAHHSLVAVAAVGCCPATRCQVHQRTPPLATHAALAPRKAAAVWTPAVRDRRHAVSWPLSMTSEPGRSGSCLECRRAWITDSTRPDAQASWPCLA